MTLGTRIAQKRKESGLSQEALGAQIGVSRQAIYKWESDASAPEIEKLMALARLFGVSVGWLLGLEEAQAAPLPPEQSGELTEAQLKMVEEIVDRYLAAQPKPKPRRKWPRVLTVLLLLAVGTNLFNRLDRLDSQYNNLQNSVSNVSSTVNHQINGISSRVEEILKSQNNLTAEYGTAIASADLKAGSITFSAHTVPKTYVEGMSADFSVDNGNGANIISGASAINQESGKQEFACRLTCEMTDHITISVTFVSPDGTRQTQILDTYEGLLTASYPLLDIRSEYHLMMTEVPEGTLTLKDAFVTVREDQAKSFEGCPAAEIVDVRLGVFRNQKLLGWATPTTQPSTFHGDYSGRQFYLLPNLTLENLTEEDKLYIAALVTDSYGRQFMACDIPYTVQSDTSFDAPYLTYASDGRYDSDPAHWEFE